MLLDGVLTPNPHRLDAVTAAWANLTGPGPTLSQAERIAAMATARAVWAGTGAPAGARTLVEEVAHKMAFDAIGMTAQVVADFEAAGLDRFRYLEVVGVVSRLANIDVYATGLGASVPPLPATDDRGPTGEIAAGVGITDGFVPATGPMYALVVLDALPSEGAAFKALHEPFYVPFRRILDGAYRDELSRAQIEYVAATSSYLNDCFY